MPDSDRLNRVTVQLLHGDVVLPWASREQLLDEIRGDDKAAAIIKAFEGVGASAPVRLTQPDKEWLAERITSWAEREKLDVGTIPELWTLREELLNDVAHNRA